MSDERKRILFVDDEAAILASLSNLLRKDRHRWDLVFAHGGVEAARLIRSSKFDIIVTDMRMPDFDGAQILELVRKESPSTVRIMLSGHADSEPVLRALPLVHQFISKPCDIKTLRGILERACETMSLTRDPSQYRVVVVLAAGAALASCCVQRAVRGACRSELQPSHDRLDRRARSGDGRQSAADRQHVAVQLRPGDLVDSDRGRNAGDSDAARDRKYEHDRASAKSRRWLFDDRAV
jgi:YesN/AraC family two-component response regulator